MAATEFRRFSSLPTEIRDIIWKAAVAPRIVHLDLVQDHTHMCSRVWSQTSVDEPEHMGFFDVDNQQEDAQFDNGPEPVSRFRCLSNVPPFFLICKESHLVAKKIYTKSFGTDYAAPSIWFNFDLDVLYMGHVIEDDSGPPDRTFLADDLGQDGKKVQNLALCNESYPEGGDWINIVLGTLGSVRTLTMVAAQNYDFYCNNLVFLDHSDVLESPEYSVHALEPEEYLHPLTWSSFFGLEREPDRRHLWQPSEWLWSQYPYFDAALLNMTADDTRIVPVWSKPELQYRPVTTFAERLDFLQRKEAHNRERDAERVRVTLTAEKYNSLELRVPWLTTFAALISMFCQARRIDEVDDVVFDARFQRLWISQDFQFVML
ncbi:hypothetical protein LSUE1_G007084 [Lachnellula suecica]|uniref:2EXR domain-containing protein n=1 Tax=Lachnellula suecica TaxID=602035 RepID=A0A8T9C8L5_9HELO|nr:hypothetical protein LSUE1_G007084 [Lachnellula suecica]